jgi:hypothetical protein
MSLPERIADQFPMPALRSDSGSRIRSIRDTVHVVKSTPSWVPSSFPDRFWGWGPVATRLDGATGE